MDISWLPEPEGHPLWPDILAMLAPAVLRDGVEAYEPGDWVWIIYQGPLLVAAAITRIWRDGEAELTMVGGCRSSVWMGLLDETISDWARSGGSTKLTARARKGWARFAARFGWVALGTDNDGLTIYAKELASG